MDENVLQLVPEEVQQPPQDVPPPLEDANVVGGVPSETAAASETHGDSEEQLCKICRLGSEEGNPLYYPCKCSVRRPPSSRSCRLL